MRLSCAEIRRLFWQLVLLVERSAAAILHWSWWRRWHQAWARYYHYRQRLDEMPARASPAGSEEAVPSEPSASRARDRVEEVWQRLAPLLPSHERGGRPYNHDRRVIVEAIVYQMQTGCAWNALPPHFPPYQTVHTQLRRWQKSGIWEIAWNEGLEQPCPTG